MELNDLRGNVGIDRTMRELTLDEMRQVAGGFGFRPDGDLTYNPLVVVAVAVVSAVSKML